jgi:SAM-dependent methyltransferase
MSELYTFGPETSYADGGESAVERAVAAAIDRRVQSVELAAHMVDWPTTYHLSRARTNLLRPFRWRAGLRVLEIGAGCGALTRFLGETGAEVHAIEPAVARARVAALRTSDLSNVRVGVGRLADFTAHAPFDVVLVIGVIEYCERYGQSADEFLACVRRLVAPTGVLVLAIENQLGLKYQLGHVEDHVGRPFVGIEGYLDAEGVRTFSRHRLEKLVEHAGFARQRWLYPFPDYKLPSSIVDARGFSTPDEAGLHLSLIRDVVTDPVSAAMLPFEPRRAMASWAAAGLAAHVSNSFLVVAGTQASVSDFVEPDVSLWQFTSARRLAPWGACRRFMGRTAAGGPAVVRSSANAPELSREREWLRQVVLAERPFVRGVTLLDDLRDAAERRDESGVAAVCLMLRAELERHAVSPDAARDGSHDAAHDLHVPVSHPFASWSPLPGPRLPGRFLDVAFDNFVRDARGCHFIDAEWEAQGHVDLFAVLARALRLVAERASSWRARPWPETWSGTQVFLRLLALAGVPHDEHVVEQSIAAEVALQCLVLGGSVDEHRAQALENLRPSALAASAAGVAETTVRAWAERAASEVAARDHEVARLGQALTTEVAARDQEIVRLNEVLAEVTAWAQKAAADVALRDEQVLRLSAALERARAKAS